MLCDIVFIIFILFLLLFCLQCYYIGATDDAATSIVQQAMKPLLYGKPVEKICEDLKSKDSQICQLRFGMA